MKAYYPMMRLIVDVGNCYLASYFSYVDKNFASITIKLAVMLYVHSNGFHKYFCLNQD